MSFVVGRPHYMADRHCGYCKGTKNDHYALDSQKEKADKAFFASSSESIFIGSTVELMDCQHYDELMNQGFRRSGKFLYKPDQLRSCCRMYTIRTDLSYLKVNKQQRKILNRFIRAIGPENENENNSKSHKNQEKYDLKSLLEAEKNSTRFHTTYEPSMFTKEKFELYKKYQISVHNDKPNEVSEKSFERFLCETPFLEPEEEGTPEQWKSLQDWTKKLDPQRSNHIPKESRRIGPTHECYYLDDKLIAVSILDFLPSGVSSIYFIWDPDYAHLSLGTVSGLREILMCNELQLGYYYLGYYIDDCPKMNYKSKFGGEILDLTNEVYVPLTTVKPWLDKGRYFSIGNKNDSQPIGEPDIDNNGKPISFESSRFFGKECINSAELIYGNTHTEEVAKAAKKTLTSKYDVLLGNSRGYFNLPDVVPGITPLWKILQMFESGVLSDEFTVHIAQGQTIQPYKLGQLNGVGRQVVVDCIRLFGLDKVKQAIILV
ncbi:arginyl-tRNA-protein transferase [Scheffersomyces xylosifermentans]|uniref:arginyl-tRNA-protein transferase n=1 Tax=Scheffersomyces xylosifermentans TaxID=1304137 RepID=UPI00315D93C1